MLADGVVVRPGGVRQVVDHQRGVVQLGLHLGPLVVEHPQRVDLRAPPGVLVEVQLRQELHEQLAVLRPAGGVAQRGQQQLEVGQPQVAEALHAERHHLGVQRRVVDAERLHVDLGEVPVAAGLRPLVAERRADRPELHRQRAVVQPVLDEGPHQPGGQLRAQRQRAAAAVVEGVHLLRDDVGGLAHPAGEDGGLLEHRRLDVAVARPAQRRGQRVADGEEARGVRRQGVERALRARSGRSQPRPAALRRRRRPRPGRGSWPARARSSSPGRGRAARPSRRPAAGRRRAASASIASHDPPGRSTRPTEPANSTSPASSPGASPEVDGEHDRALGVPGRVPDGQLDAGQRQHARRRPGGLTSRGSGSRTPAISGASCGPCQRAGSREHAEVVGVQVGGDVVAVAHRQHGEGVVEVAVGEHDGDRLEAVVGQHPGRAARRRPCRDRRRRTPARGRTPRRSSWCRTRRRGRSG